jgi:two-component system, NtrC family, response regulator AtoC
MPAPTVHQSNVANVGAQGTGAEGTLHLTVMAPNVFETFPLPTSGSITIGRDELADVRITDDLASRMHARLDVESSARLTVEDLGSSNGTFVRGEKIEPGRRVALQLGEALTIGFTHLMVQRRRPAAPARRLHGHGAFEERLEDACARAVETAAAVAIVRVQIEDEEPAGRGADPVAGALRPGDFLAQYAPGDYEAMLLDTDADRARAIADDAARRVRAEGLRARTVVATCPADGRSAEALIGRTSALLRDSADERPSDPVLKSEAMRALYRLAERAAAGRTATGLINILVLGETGAGKEVLSDWIHRRSPRAGGPFVCINCGALTDTLLESELFGHEKGAFTGAAQAKPGLLEAAAGGTVFLDEIGDMPSSLQTKLLRAIESRQITRVGGLSQRPIDVRFIAATNLDLEAGIARKTFRQDLYFRLNGISLTIPPLRDRPDEIAPLARRFLAAASSAEKRRPPRLSDDALDILRGYGWPGNIRELRNVMERALVLCEGSEIGVEHLPMEKMRLVRPVAPAAPADAPVSIAAAGGALATGADVERQRILAVLAEAGGNQTRAAKILGIARGTLIERLKRYGIKRPQS